MRCIYYNNPYARIGLHTIMGDVKDGEFFHYYSFDYRRIGKALYHWIGYSTNKWRINNPNYYSKVNQAEFNSLIIIIKPHHIMDINR